MDSLSYVVAMEELSKVDNSCSVAVSVNNSLVCWGLETYGTEAQKLYDDAQVLLDKMIEERWIQANGCMGIFPVKRIGDDVIVLDPKNTEK